MIQNLEEKALAAVTDTLSFGLPIPVQKLLSKAYPVILDKELGISCTSMEDVKAIAMPEVTNPLIARIRQLKLDYRWLSIYLVKERQISFQIEKQKTEESMSLKLDRTPEIIQAINQFDSCATLVARDFQGQKEFVLHSNNGPTQKFTGLNPASYFGKSAANLWIPKYLEQMWERLDQNPGDDSHWGIQEWEYLGYRKKDVDEYQQEGLPLEAVPEVPLCISVKKVVAYGLECRLTLFQH